MLERPDGRRGEEATVRRVTRHILVVTAPVHLLICATTVGALVVAWRAHGQVDPDLLVPFVRLQLISLVGLAGSFVLHESAHLVALYRCPGVRAVTLSTSIWRVTLQPTGTMTPAQVIAVACAGPGACAAVGGTVLLVAPELWVHWFYLAHVIFLLPVFGDGASIVKTLRTARRRPRVL